MTAQNSDAWWYGMHCANVPEEHNLPVRSHIADLRILKIFPELYLLFPAFMMARLILT